MGGAFRAIIDLSFFFLDFSLSFSLVRSVFSSFPPHILPIFDFLFTSVVTIERPRVRPADGSQLGSYLTNLCAIIKHSVKLP